MLLRRLRISNFMIFGEADIDLSDVGLASIIGEYVSDRRRSNGAGKSAFMESIRFALFDQTRGKSKQGVVREGCDSCSVDLTFEVGGSVLRVVRSRSRTGASKAKLSIDGKSAGDKVRVVNGVISERIGVDADLFDLIYFFKQGDQFGFAEANPSDRKGILSKVFRMRQLERCSDLAKSGLRSSKEKAANVEGAIQATQQRLDNCLDKDQLIEQSLSTSSKLANLMQLKDVRKQSFKELDSAANDARSHSHYFSAMAGSDENQIATIQLAIQEIEKGLKSKRKLLFERQEKTQQARQTYELLKNSTVKPEGDIEDLKITRANMSDNLRVFTAKCIAAKADVATCSQQLRAMQVDGDECPTCGQEIQHEKCEDVKQELKDTVESLNDFIADLERNIDMCDAEVAACTRKISDHEQYAFKVKTCENAWNNVQLYEDLANEQQDDIDKMLADKESLTKELERVSTSQMDDYAKLSQQFVGKISDLSIRVAEAQDALSEQIADAKEQSMNAEFELASYVQINEQLSVHCKDREQVASELAVSTALTEAFGKDGIQALIIENALGSIEQFANEMLQQMQTRFVIELKTQKQTKSGEERESLDILIYDGAGVRAFESYSGGERTLINLALRLALSKAISAMHGVSIQSLFMDEVFGALDEVNREEVVKVLSFLSRSFAQVLVVSHTDQVKDVIDSGIVIRRYDDWSDIRKTDARGKEASSSSAG